MLFAQFNQSIEHVAVDNRSCAATLISRLVGLAFLGLLHINKSLAIYV